MKNEFIDYLQDIIDCMSKIENFTRDINFEEFTSDEKTIFAVIRALEIIGEAVKKVPKDIKNKHEEIPWRLIAGMRDKLIHEYSGVNVKVIWRTIKEDIPKINPLFLKLLEEYR